MNESNPKRRNTETSSFGTPGRISHDAEKFYASRLYEGVPGDQEVHQVENKIPAGDLDRLYCKSSEKMDDVPDSSVHLMITSPPYNASKDYDQDLNLSEYLQMLGKVWQETFRVLVPGGRACINVANLGRKPYIPLHVYIVDLMMEIGFLMRGEIIWNKASSASQSRDEPQRPKPRLLSPSRSGARGSGPASPSGTLSARDAAVGPGRSWPRTAALRASSGP